MNPLLVVLISYFIVYLVESFFYEYSVSVYYLALIFSTFIITAICCYRPSAILIGYSFLQVCCGFLYLSIICTQSDMSYYLMYDAAINFGLILYCYEASIVAWGAFDGLLVVFDRFKPGYDFSAYALSSNKKGFK